MTDEQKVFIRGVDGRENEVRQALINLGGRNVHDFYHGDSEGFFYITHDGEIRFELESSEIGKIIIDNYRELHLPKLWQDGEVIACIENPQKFAVCDGVEDMQYGEVMTRFVVDEERIEMRASVRKDEYKLASPTGKLRFASLLHCHGKEWDADKKQLTDWRWQPKDGECFYVVDEFCDVALHAWEKGKDFCMTYFILGNCFPTKEKAKKVAEKFKELLRSETKNAEQRD